MRLKRLIKQILVFRKTESGNMKLRVLQSDVVAFVRNICHSSFNPQVTENEIDFTVDIQYDSYQAWFDPDKLDKIIYNILSNAFKYTPKGGSIAVKMSFVPRGNEVIMRLSVSDTGIGIPEQDLPHIFRRFYISSTSDQSQSHGIGLSLTHDLLEIHHGKIEVMSQVGEGSVFTIEIPVSETAYVPDEKLNDEENVPDDETQAVNEQDIVSTEAEAASDLMFNILVVEDNKGLNKLIAENFADKYRVFTAENGLQGLQIVKDQEIDLIISDVMMPEMDGLTFCKIIKNDLNTSHIAVLMLTAKNSAEDRIECYNAGADAFIAKPFEIGVLNARVKNLIGKIRQKAENFQQGVEINISSMEYNSIDEVFLKSAVNKVEEKLSEESFDFDEFAIDMATSKSTLHRKLKSLTGLSPGEFIRNIRMKHAVQMLNNNIGNISEIAYAVGFNDPKYFSRCFKAEFGMTPKEWMDQNRKKK
jgi:DNA-binding response OmpR family regulator